MIKAQGGIFGWVTDSQRACSAALLPSDCRKSAPLASRHGASHG